VIIDTPGFDDPKRSDSEVLNEISRMLSAQYQLKIPLKGIIYLHRITDVRVSRGDMNALRIFRKICGEQALSNVLLVTTRWGEVDESIGAQREKELRQDFWACMESCPMYRFFGDKGSAMGIVSQLLGKANIVLEIQRELVEEQMPLNETSAGSAVSHDIAELKQQLQQDPQGRAKLDLAAEDEERLKRNIANETLQEIREDAAQKRRKGVIPKILDSLQIFMRANLVVTDKIAEWFIGIQGGDTPNTP
jgi:hypothetical protein